MSFFVLVIEKIINVEYKSIAEIVKRLNEEIEKLENGEMSVEELEVVLNDVRALHERIAILQYLAVQSQPSTKEKSKSSTFSFGVDQSMLDSLREPTNQTNLLDAIEQENVPEKQLFEEPQEEEIQKVEEEIVMEETKVETVNDKISQTKEETKSVNDSFSSQNEVESLAQKLGKKPIEDLTKAIGLNQKFLFMNDLFEGENNLYNEAIKALNGFNSYFEADEYLNVLSSRHSWDSTSKSVKEFVDLVERRYS